VLGRQGADELVRGAVAGSRVSPVPEEFYGTS